MVGVAGFAPASVLQNAATLKVAEFAFLHTPANTRAAWELSWRMVPGRSCLKNR